MNFLPTFRVFLLCCFAYVSLTTCQPLESISEDTLNRGLQELSQEQYNRYLLYSIPAASLGKNLFKISQNVDEDCVRTAKVILQALYTPHTSITASHMMFASVNHTVAHRTGSTFRSQFDLVCKNLNTVMKWWGLLYINVEELKKAAQVPSPAKNYIFEISAGQKVTEWSRTTPTPFDEPEFLKFHIANTMVKFIHNMTSFDENQQESVRLARGIYQAAAAMNSNDGRISKLFLDTLNDFVKNPPIQQQGDQTNRADGSFYTIAFLKKVHQNLLNNDELKKDYEMYSSLTMDTDFFKVPWIPDILRLH